MGLDQSRLLKVGVTAVQETPRGAHQSPEMGAVVTEVCRDGVKKSRESAVSSTCRIHEIRPHRASGKANRNPSQPKPGHRKAKVRPFQLRWGGGGGGD